MPDVRIKRHVWKSDEMVAKISNNARSLIRFHVSMLLASGLTFYKNRPHIHVPRISGSQMRHPEWRLAQGQHAQFLPSSWSTLERTMGPCALDERLFKNRPHIRAPGIWRLSDAPCPRPTCKIMAIALIDACEMAIGKNESIAENFVTMPFSIIRAIRFVAPR